MLPHLLMKFGGQMSSIKPINFADMANSIDAYHFGWPEKELAAYIKQYQSKYYGSVDDAQFEITDDEGDVYYAVFKNFAEYEVAIKSKDYLLFKDQGRALFNVGGKIYRFLIKERKLDETVQYCHHNFRHIPPFEPDQSLLKLKDLGFDTEQIDQIEKEQYLLKLKTLGFDIEDLEKPYLICNDENSTDSHYFHSLSSPQHEVMIVVDAEGIAAINWDGVLWKHKLYWASNWDLTLIAINGNNVITEYQNVVSLVDTRYNKHLDLELDTGLYRILFDIQTGCYKKEIIE